MKKLRLLIGVPSIFLALIGAGIVDPLIYVYRSIIAQCIFFCTNKNTPPIKAGYVLLSTICDEKYQKSQDFNGRGKKMVEQTHPPHYKATCEAQARILLQVTEFLCSCLFVSWYSDERQGCERITIFGYDVLCMNLKFKPS